MASLRLFIARCRALFRRDVISEEIREELQFHVDMRAADYERGGADGDEARRQARRRFGNLAVIQDRGYDVRGAGLLESIVQDIRYGARLLIKDRGFSLVAILTLALGIGVSTAMFSVIDAALIRPLPYPKPEELVELSIDVPSPGPAGGRSQYAPSIEDIRAWRVSGDVFSNIGTGRVSGFMPLIVDAGEPERLVVGSASEDFLEVFGVRPVAGRLFTANDTKEDPTHVALLGYAYWQSRFNRADVIGRSIRIENTAATIIGILPAGFYPNTAVWRASPHLLPWQMQRGSGTPVFGRLRPGVSLAQARQRLTVIARSQPVRPGWSSDVNAVVESLYQNTISEYSSTVATLAYAVSALMVMALVNVAGLLIARGSSRRAELAVRRSLGASRTRVARQLLTESMVLSGVGGSLGVVLACLTLNVIVAIIPMTLPENSPATISGGVLLVATVTTVLSSIAFGLVPSIRFSDADLVGRAALAGHRQGTAFSRRSGKILVAAQIGLAVVLLVCAGLLLRSFDRLLSVDVGFDPASVLTMEVEPAATEPATLRRYYDRLIADIRKLPEVEAAGGISSLPLGNGASRMGFLKRDPSGTGLMVREITPGYFEAMGLPARSGRSFTETDWTDGESVAVVNEAARKQFFSGANPIGAQIEIDGPDERPMRVVGVVGNIRPSGPRGRIEPEVFRLYGRGQPGALSVVMRTRSGESPSSERLRNLARASGTPVVIGNIRRGSEWLGERVETQRNRAVLLSLLGAFGLALTLVGIFSATAYAVVRRTQEIGIRVAFGATPLSVVMAIVADMAWPVVIGVMVGMGAAWFATSLVRTFLFQTTSRDPVSFTVVAAFMAATALIAAWIPARRAARVDPVIALRAE